MILKLIALQDTSINVNISDSSVKSDSNTIIHFSDAGIDEFADSSIVSDRIDTIKETSRPSLFTIQKTTSDKIEPTEHSFVSHDWITIHLLICIGLIAWIQIYYRNRLKQIFKAFVGARYLNQLSRDGNIFRERIAIPLLVIYFVSFSLLIYLIFTEVLEKSLPDISELKLFSGIMLIIILLFFIKNVVITFIGNVFRNYLILSEYILTNFIFNLTIGLILIPVLIFSVYMHSKEMVYTGLILWVLVFLYRIIRELFIGLSYQNFSLFYRILYLCTLEIVPLLVLTKLAMSYLT
ncbi:MAG: hypothetical protein B6D61_00740 [Bacteroidetes bacterium 4484_249]|nr:MAG: hypothetical protein B6D61_00740 [Bacteroidetes bacterium 4484_249]